MAWTTPMTAVSNERWLATEFNTHVRDNLNETEVAKVTAAGQYFVSTGANALAARSAGSADEDNAGTTTSTSYTATLSGSPGTNPSVTKTTGTKALVHIACRQSNSIANTYTRVSFAVSGATSMAANDAWSIRQDGTAANQFKRFGYWTLIDCASGSNTFTMQYKVEANTGTFAFRHIIVVPL